MTDAPTNPTDIAICRLLAAEPLRTADLAARLAIPERTARHRLLRLRQAGAVVTDINGRHHLAETATTASIAGSLPAGDSQATTVPTTRPLPPRDGTAVDLAAPVMGPGHPDQDGSPPRQGRRWGPAAVVAAVAFGVAAAAGIGIAVARLRMASPAPPAPSQASPALPAAAGFVYPGDPWGGMQW